MTLQLPEGPFAAYLFDCDGTIVDSMPLHFIAWNRALSEYGCTSFSEDNFYRMGGIPVADVVAELNRRDGLAIPVEEFAHRKECLCYELIHDLQPIPEVLEHIHASHGKIPFAVVSGSTRQSVEMSLSVLGILNLFDVLVCAGDYRRGKPDPEPFLLAAQRLGVEPNACLVFEDAEVGIRAATAAGMASIRIAQPWERVPVLEQSDFPISYGLDVHRRVGAAIGLAVISLDLGALMLLSKSKKHYIGLTWANGDLKGGFAMQCDKNDYRGVLTALEGISGKKAVNSDAMTVKN
jgi:HAD superfamily hydrolase (TIGR01509 family)